MDISESVVIVTGATGFVGVHLVERLLSSGAKVLCLVRKQSAKGFRSYFEKEISAELLSIEHSNILELVKLTEIMKKTNPDYVFHLAAQGIPSASINKPLEAIETNAIGTMNILEAIRRANIDPRIVYSGSSHSYGIVVFSEHHYDCLIERFGYINPEPTTIPELPLTENSPLRPTTPYAVGKLAGDLFCAQYARTYGMKTIVCRSFNHEGARRRINFVTAFIANNLARYRTENLCEWNMGDINTMRDWSHVDDIVRSYLLLAENGQIGTVYNVGSGRTNSILSFILWGIESLGYEISMIDTFDKSITLRNPSESTVSELYGIKFLQTKVDSALLSGELAFDASCKGVTIYTNGPIFRISYSSDAFQTSLAPVIICDNKRISKMGFRVTSSVRDIVGEQIRYHHQKIQTLQTMD